MQACPSVNGCVTLLGVGELGGFPVGELLAFADFLLEKDGKDLLQAHVRNLILCDQLLQLDESCGMDVANAGELVEVVGSRQTDLGVTAVFEELLEWGGDAGLVQAKQEGVVVGSQLQQGDVVALTAAEAGSRLGVKADDACRAQCSDGAFYLRDGVDDMDLPLEGDKPQEL